jgi:flagellar hook-basal body complex protein FliE
MTAAIPPIGNIANIANITAPTDPTTAANGANAASGDFGNKVVDALDNLQQTQNNADALSLKAATGTLSDVHTYMIAATEAATQTELTTAVRDKAVEAFNDIMRMNV